MWLNRLSIGWNQKFDNLKKKWRLIYHKSVLLLIYYHYYDHNYHISIVEVWVTVAKSLKQIVYDS